MTVKNRTVRKYIKVDDEPKDFNMVTYAYVDAFVNDDNEVFGYTQRQDVWVPRYQKIDLWDKVTKENKIHHIQQSLEKSLLAAELMVADIKQALADLEENGIDDLVL